MGLPHHNARNLNHMDEGIFDVERTTALETFCCAKQTR